MDLFEDVLEVPFQPQYVATRALDVGIVRVLAKRVTDYYRLVGICAGKILSGEKPADLPVTQSTKFDFSQRRICP